MAAQLHLHVKLRTFSGRVPFPNHEVNYDTWRSSVEFYLTDSTVSQPQLLRKMVDSLLPPAVHVVVKSLGPRATPCAYLDLLDSAYATVEDGDELFAKFLNTHQNSGEKPSDYLHRLQSCLNEVVKKKAVSTRDADKQLLKQFCRGCWDNILIATLQFEQRQSIPPTFSEFLLMLRTEDKQAAKVSRMKHHLGFPKAKAQASIQALRTSEMNDFGMQIQDNRMASLIEQIQKQITSMQAQIAALSAFKGDKSVKPKTTKMQKAKPSQSQPNGQKEPLAQRTTPRPRPWYCFRCGRWPYCHKL